MITYMIIYTYLFFRPPHPPISLRGNMRPCSGPSSDLTSPNRMLYIFPFKLWPLHSLLCFLNCMRID